MLILDDQAVRRLLSPEVCLEVVERGFRRLAAGQAADGYAHLDIQKDIASLHLYGGWVAGTGAGAKVLGAFSGNPALGLPYIRALVVLLDLETGEPEAVLDGRYLTALRTGAATALGARLLQSAASRVLGILGTGLQARTHLLCHLAAHAYERVLVWGRTPANLKAYLAEVSSQAGVRVEAAVSPRAVCEQADVVVCVTAAESPLFPERAVRSGMHLGVVAPMNEQRTEIPLELLASSRLFVDSRSKFEAQWGAGAAPPVAAELGEVLVGLAPGRSTDEEVTIFKPEGLAMEDIVSAREVVDAARRTGVGVDLTWG